MIERIKPVVSVLLPLYNESTIWAQKAIDSILKQTYHKLEVILLLDNPDNEELKWLIKRYEKQDKRIKTFINEKNLGLPETLNKGIELSTGDFIARMDGDDICVSVRIELQLKFLLEHPEIDLVGSNAYIIDEVEKITGEYRKLSTDFSQKVMLKYAGINMIHPTWLGKSEIFRVCMYRNFMYCEDYDFMVRACAAGYKFHNMNEKLLYYRVVNQAYSISRKHAYEQYINTCKVRMQFKQFRKKELKYYPELPELFYDQNDALKYQSTISLLNQLRESFFKKNLLLCIKLCIKILKIDHRPLTSRFRVYFVSKILFLLELIRNKGTAAS